MCGFAAIASELSGILVKFCLAVFRTKIKCSAFEIRLPGGIGRVDLHSADRVFFRSHNIYSFVGMGIAILANKETKA